MVPIQAFSLEKDIYYDREDADADTFLYDLLLYKRKRTTVANETDAVCRHLAAILKQGNAPRKSNNAYYRPLCRHSRGLQFQVPVPCKCHENITQYEQNNCV